MQPTTHHKEESPYPVQMDDAFRRQWNRYSFWSGLSILVGLVATLIDVFHAKRFGTAGWFGFASFAFGMVLIHRKYNHSLTNYTCPACDRPLDEPRHRKTRHNELAVMFDCETCQTTWDTSLREDED
ncbi:MAG: hypothetical protein ACPGYV_09755 [Phycisphaeraceae bacterium]